MQLLDFLPYWRHNSKVRTYYYDKYIFYTTNTNDDPPQYRKFYYPQIFSFCFFPRKKNTSIVIKESSSKIFG